MPLLVTMCSKDPEVSLGGCKNHRFQDGRWRLRIPLSVGCRLTGLQPFTDVSINNSMFSVINFFRNRGSLCLSLNPPTNSQVINNDSIKIYPRTLWTTAKNKNWAKYIKTPHSASCSAWWQDYYQNSQVQWMWSSRKGKPELVELRRAGRICHTLSQGNQSLQLWDKSDNMEGSNGWKPTIFFFLN